MWKSRSHKMIAQATERQQDRLVTEREGKGKRKLPTPHKYKKRKKKKER